MGPAAFPRVPAQPLVAGAVLVLLPVAILAVQGDWRLAGGALAVVLMSAGSLVRPDLMASAALLAFLGANMPVLNPGGLLFQARWVMLAALAIGVLLRSTTEKSLARFHPMHFCLALFVTYAVISSSFSLNGLMTLLKAASFGCLILAATLYGRLECRQGWESPCKLLEQLWWCAVLAGAGCLLAVLHVLPRLPVPYIGFAGPFGNPNALGAFIPLAAPVVLLKLVHSRDKSPLARAAILALTAGFAVVLLMSRSRTGIIATFAACAFWLFFVNRRVFAVFVIGAIVGGIIMLAYRPGYVESLNEVYMLKGGTYILQSREEPFRASWEAAMESPVIGVGFGVSRGYSEDWQFGFETGLAGREKGNSFLGLLEEVGVVGSAFVLLPIGWVLTTAIRRLTPLRRSNPSAGGLWTVLTLSACLVGGLVDALGEAWLTAAGSFISVMFWLVLAVLAARLTASAGAAH